MKRSYQLAVVVIGLLVLSLAMPTEAAKKAGGGKNGKNRTASQPATQPAESPQIVAARAAVAAAKDKLDAVVAKLLDPFSKSQAYQDAETALATASASLKSARAAVMAKLTASDDYQQALKDREDAKTEMHLAGDNDSSATESFADAEAKYLAASAKVGKLELDAATADPATKAAQAKYDQAKTAWDAQMAQFQEIEKQDPDWQAAKKAYDDADAKLQAVFAAQKK